MGELLGVEHFGQKMKGITSLLLMEKPQSEDNIGPKYLSHTCVQVEFSTKFLENLITKISEVLDLVKYALKK